MKEFEKMFYGLKEYIGQNPLLLTLVDEKSICTYLSISKCEVSLALLEKRTRGVQQLVYYMSKAFQDAKVK